MNDLKTELSLKLDHIRQILSCGFSAVALLDQRVNRIRWECVSGNLSERFHQMVKKPGEGITGHVVRYGRPFILDLSVAGLEQSRQRYPIMLAEQIQSLMAFPLYKDEKIVGVLVIGDREKRRYSSDEISTAVQISESISV